jgi:hypothetical protein
LKIKDERFWKRNRIIKELEERDGCIGCRLCGSLEDLTIDHVIPKSLGGQNTFENKQVLCRRCNILKDDLPPGQNGWWPDGPVCANKRTQMRTKLPATLQYLEARELRDFLRRAIREKNFGEWKDVRAEYKRRGIRLSNADYWPTRKMEVLR